MRTMSAKYRGRCRRCGFSIDVGQTIRWSRATGSLCETDGVCQSNLDYASDLATQEAEQRMERFAAHRHEGLSTEQFFENEDYERGSRLRAYASGGGFGYDPEVPAGFQDADLEMAELERQADEEMRWEGEMIAREEERYDRPATESEAHAEWHRNAGIPMGTPGCPWDACHVDDDPDYGGAFDGFTVTSDADPGL